MDRLRGQLLAGARLALDEHGRVERCDAVHAREELAHGNALADELTERVRRPEVDRGRLAETLDPEHGTADEHRATVRYFGFRYPHVLHERSVAAAEVSDPDAPVARIELRVDAGNGRIRDFEVIARSGPDPDSPREQHLVAARCVGPGDARLLPHGHPPVDGGVGRNLGDRIEAARGWHEDS